MKHRSLLLPLALFISLSACQSRPPMPEPRYMPNIALNASETLEVMPCGKACHSAPPMQCLLVKPIGADDDKLFGIGYNDIIGFTPAIGTAYTIKVRQEIDQNTGKPTGQWQLDEILTQSIR